MTVTLCGKLCEMRCHKLWLTCHCVSRVTGRGGPVFGTSWDSWLTEEPVRKWEERGERERQKHTHTHTHTAAFTSSWAQSRADFTARGHYWWQVKARILKKRVHTQLLAYPQPSRSLSLSLHSRALLTLSSLSLSLSPARRWTRLLTRPIQ